MRGCPHPFHPFCPSFAARSLGKEQIDIFDMLSHNCTHDKLGITFDFQLILRVCGFRDKLSDPQMPFGQPIMTFIPQLAPLMFGCKDGCKPIHGYPQRLTSPKMRSSLLSLDILSRLLSMSVGSHSQT